MQPHRLEFRDALFAYQDMQFWSACGGACIRQVPIGMPKLGDAIAQCAFFLYEKDPNASPDSQDFLGPVGSGIIIGIQEDVSHTASVSHFYAVTAAHVARTGGSIISVNTCDGKKRPIELDPCEWEANIPWEDIAIADITEHLNLVQDTGDAISFVPIEAFLTEDIISAAEIGIGEEGFMLGLFGEHSGTASNLIAARFGNISLLSDFDAPISRYDPGLKVTFKSPCHVFDMHSRAGFSGSPVFVYRTVTNDFRDMVQRSVKQITKLNKSMSIAMRSTGLLNWNLGRFLLLLGIHVGQFQDQIKISKENSEYAEKKSNQEINDGDIVRFPSSMTIVVPAWQILKLLETPTLKQKRDARMAAAKIADLANPNRGAVVLEKKSVFQADQTDVNPHHREDFMSLLGAAAKGRSPEDQT
jgi:hypothetical protein